MNEMKFGVAIYNKKYLNYHPQCLYWEPHSLSTVKSLGNLVMFVRFYSPQLFGCDLRQTLVGHTDL